VSFGDVLLVRAFSRHSFGYSSNGVSALLPCAHVDQGEEQIRVGPNGGQMNPGQGGWPTIRYFNKETGYDGAPYDKKLPGAMCDVLKNLDNMRAYVTMAREGASDEAKALAAAHASETPEEKKARKKKEMQDRIAAKRAAKAAGKEL
jgi:hypothetical protein